MSLKINEIITNTFSQSNTKSVNGNNKINEPLLKFKSQDEENGISIDELLAWSEQKTEKTPKEATEDFQKDVMRMLNIKDLQKSENANYYLGELVTVMQKLNGVNSQNLKPNGDFQQNEMYEARMKQMTVMMNDYAQFVSSYSGSDVKILEDAKTGQFKISIGNKLLDVPERKVKIVPEETIDMVELMPAIVD